MPSGPKKGSKNAKEDDDSASSNGAETVTSLLAKPVTLGVVLSVGGLLLAVLAPLETVAVYLESSAKTGMAELNTRLVYLKQSSDENGKKLDEIKENTRACASDIRDANTRLANVQERMRQLESARLAPIAAAPASTGSVARTANPGTE